MSVLVFFFFFNNNGISHVNDMDGITVCRVFKGFERYLLWLIESVSVGTFAIPFFVVCVCVCDHF